jgi:hypothetical protein
MADNYRKDPEAVSRLTPEQYRVTQESATEPPFRLFLGMQDLIRKFPGVVSTRVGYTGGDVQNATYSNHKGHAEASRSSTTRPRPPTGTCWSSSTPPACSPARSSPRSPRSPPPARSGRPSPSTRTTWSTTLTATPATTPPRLGAPAPDRRQSSGPFALTGASPPSWSLTRRAVAPHPPVGEGILSLDRGTGSRSPWLAAYPAQFDSTVGIQDREGPGRHSDSRVIRPSLRRAASRTGQSPQARLRGGSLAPVGGLVSPPQCG